MELCACEEEMLIVMKNAESSKGQPMSQSTSLGRERNLNDFSDPQLRKSQRPQGVLKD